MVTKRKRKGHIHRIREARMNELSHPKRWDKRLGKTGPVDLNLYREEMGAHEREAVGTTVTTEGIEVRRVSN